MFCFPKHIVLCSYFGKGIKRVTYRIYWNKRRPRISAASGTKKLISATLK